MSARVENLLLAGGVGHPSALTATALEATLGPIGVSTTTFEDIEAGCRVLAAGRYRMLTVSALRWRMTNDEKYAPERGRWALSLSSAAREAIATHVRSGGGLLALHTAPICFDDWPQWQEILGGRWVWGTSRHPPYGPADWRPTAVRHPITHGLEPFECRDEVYGRLELARDIEALAEARACEADEGWMPVLWARRWHLGRVVYDALGHDGGSLDAPMHRRLIQRAALWVIGAGEREMSKL